ncbi:unnamed protein product [Paramecium sonneborni]|uniref:Uncharacterized protein n=2 Tax=Paramecium sonneborni TaxID=65129 RepID=A0A8S1QQH4_9CILI|nr:unnamed protein product [Paramecium sonneborni]
MSKQLNQNSLSIEEKIKKIYETTAPVQFRSELQLYDEQLEMQKDCQRYFFSDYQIENIQYQLRFKQKRKEENKVVYTFDIKQLLPKSQLLETTAFVKSQFGCKILKTKASNTLLEMHLEISENKNDNKQIIEVFLGSVQNKFKIRLSNYVQLEHC